MLGILNAAVRYIFAPASRPSPDLASRSSGDATAMPPTDSSRERLGTPHSTVREGEHTLKNGGEQPQDATGLLDQLLSFDEQITSYIGFYSHPKTKFQQIVKRTCKILEVSGHGVPWFAISGILILLHFITGNLLFYQYGLNLFIVLISDLVVVAPLKIFFKRPRPVTNIGTIPLSMSHVDNYAFPSGHASRCVALAAYFCYMPPFNPWTHLWYIWGLLVSLSRVAICRHHVMDVVAGMVGGLIIFDMVRRLGILFEI